MVVNAINHKSRFNIIHPASGLKEDIILYKDTELDRTRFADLEKSNQQKNIELFNSICVAY